MARNLVIFPHIWIIWLFLVLAAWGSTVSASKDKHNGEVRSAANFPQIDQEDSALLYGQKSNKIRAKRATSQSTDRQDQVDNATSMSPPHTSPSPKGSNLTNVDSTKTSPVMEKTMDMAEDERKKLTAEILASIGVVMDKLVDVAGSLLSIDVSFPQNMSARDIWILGHDVIRGSFDMLLKRSLPLFMRGDFDFNIISSECQSAALKFVLDMRAGKLWPLQMLDANAKPLSGILRGNTFFFGSYDQCLDISVADVLGDSELKGQYCLVGISPPLPPKPKRITLKALNQKPLFDFRNTTAKGTIIEGMANVSFAFYDDPTVTLGLCIPSSCSPKDLDRVFKSLKERFHFNTTILSCEVKEPFRLNAAQKSWTIGYGILLIFVLVGTIVEYFRHKSQAKQQRISAVTKAAPRLFFAIIESFSAIQNTSKLLPGKQSVAFPALEGLRIIVMAWIILGHTYMGSQYQNALNEKQNLADFFRNDIFYHGILNSHNIVIMFFVIGAFLMGFDRLSSETSFSFPKTVASRYIRLIVPLLGSIGLVFIHPLIMGSGPLSKMFRARIMLLEEPCRTYWWPNVLTYSNFVFVGDMCLVHGWYVYVDFQLFVIVLITMAFLRKWPLRVLIAFGALALGLLAFAYYIFETDNLHELQPFIRPDNAAEFMTWFSFRPYLHGVPYFVGLFVAYLHLFHKNIRIHKVFQAILWLVAIGTFLSVLWGTFSWRENFVRPKAEMACYYIIGKCAWSLAIGYIVYDVTSSTSGIVGKILGWKILRPLGRLSYSIYLVHMQVIFARAMYRRTNFTVSHYNWVCEFILNFVATLPVAFAFFLLVEAPCINISKLLKEKNATPSNVDAKENSKNPGVPNGGENVVTAEHVICA